MQDFTLFVNRSLIAVNEKLKDCFKLKNRSFVVLLTVFVC